MCRETEGKYGPIKGRERSTKGAKGNKRNAARKSKVKKKNTKLKWMREAKEWDVL